MWRASKNFSALPRKWRLVPNVDGESIFHHVTGGRPGGGSNMVLMVLNKSRPLKKHAVSAMVA
jgi:hypothetical protein